MDNKDNITLTSLVFSKRIIKMICILVYVIELVASYTSLIWVLASMLQAGTANALYIFLIAVALVLIPMVLLLSFYPIYILTKIHEKNIEIIKEQKVVEYLLAKNMINKEE